MANPHNNDENNKVLHEVDGIAELDNGTPRWFNWLFYICIVFSPMYCAYWFAYQGTMTDLEGQTNAMSFSTKRLALQILEGEGKDTTNWNLVKGAVIEQYAKDPKVIARGKGLYGSKCAACHGPEAKGAGAFPNLTDKEWIYGGKIVDIEKTILNGTAKGMISFKSEKQKDIAALVVYVHSLGGGQ